MLRQFTAILATIPLCFLGCSQPAAVNVEGKFTEISPAEGKFTIQMPGSPIETFLPDGRLYCNVIGEVTYVVSYVTTTQYEDDKIIQAGLEAACESLIKNTKGKVICNKQIFLDSKYPGREILIALDNCSHMYLFRRYSVKDRDYNLSIEGPDSFVRSAEAACFFNSFLIFDQMKQL
jgi:hypothetical protein